MTTAFGGSPALTITSIAPEPERLDGTPAPDLVAPAPAAPKARRRDIIEPAANLSEDVAVMTARLGKSLGVPTDGGYDPDLFVKAVSAIHVKLVEVRNDTATWQDTLDKRETALTAREAALVARERQAEALATLAGLLPAGDPSKAPQSTVAKWVRRWLGL